MNTDTMTQYTGTKTLMAKPMTRGEYNALREWKSIPGEDQEAPGYLVEYQDGGEPNHEDFKGYISWSPKDVFENTYWPSASPEDRARQELKELVQKVMALSHFFTTDAFKELPEEQRELMRNQISLMMELGIILRARLDAWKVTER